MDDSELWWQHRPGRNSLTSAQVPRMVAHIDHAVDVVGLTIAEFIPR